MPASPASYLGFLDETDMAEVRPDVATIIEALDSSCSKVDAAVRDLRSALSAIAALERKAGGSRALRELRLSRRLHMSDTLRDVGTACQKLGRRTSAVRTAVKIFRKDFEAAESSFPVQSSGPRRAPVQAREASTDVSSDGRSGSADSDPLRP